MFGSNKIILGYYFLIVIVLFLNIIGMIIDELVRNGFGFCYDEYINCIKVIGLLEIVDVIFLLINVVYRFWL